MPWSNKKGFTLLEVLTAAVLLATAAAVLCASFLQANRFVAPQRPTAYNVAETNLNALWQAIRVDTWDQSGNSLKNGATTSDTRTLDGVTYTTSTTASTVTVAGTTTADYRKVTATTSWS